MSGTRARLLTVSLQGKNFDQWPPAPRYAVGDMAWVREPNSTIRLGSPIFDGSPWTDPPDSPIPARSSRLVPSIGRNLEDNTDLACQGMLSSTTTSVLIFMSVGPVARLNFFEKKAGPIYEYLYFISYGCAQKCRP
ncbi:hypothetical protein X797_006008 [Metarhizium robertsii]|uniref:Uncharacterized protein n=1 Tax=Metarhizium robertsii TaxID=568076 RepID=A0A0A1UUG2_9HYPO|nr:hypothetical protein X797_006008 [Metarhizium robertsii]